ncbi:hypothetical protein FS837_002388 [Tulasnella sp. UAMH 9824]|nr:hypothetical protein FS837_002388 [Tulasnella sp. UAMH 9824]
MAQPAGPTGTNPQNQTNYTSNLRRKFGEIGDFWNRYDELADSHDQRLIRNLNDNLDVLLIFMAAPSLSPDPSAQTNYLLGIIITKLDNTTLLSLPEPPSQNKDLLSVRTNCLLYASLCCSILAAVGAMLAKEWLQTFERDGQIGAVQDQVLRRQRKINGTAGVVTAFAFVGAVFYLLTTFAAAIWDVCPYQTWVSKAGKYLVQTTILPPTRRAGGWLMRSLSGSSTDAPATESDDLEKTTQEHEAEILNAQAACWLLETTSTLEDQQAAIRNLLTLSPDVCSSLVRDWYTYDQLLTLTGDLIRSWRDQPSPQTVLIAQQFTASLWHVCLGYARHSEKWTTAKSQLATRTGMNKWQHWQDSGCLELYLSDYDYGIGAPADPAAMLRHDDYSIRVVTLSMIVVGDIPFWSLDRELAWSALWHVFGAKYDDTIVALVALIISKGFPMSHSPSRDVRTLVQSAWSGKDIFDILMKAVRCGPIALWEDARPSYKDALPVFSEILRCLGELPSTKEFIRHHPEDLLPDVARLTLAVNEVYDTAHSSGVLSELGEFMAGALRLLRVCNPAVKQGQLTPLLFNGTLVAFIRSNQFNSSDSATATQTFDWLNDCLRESEYDWVTARTISYMMRGFKTDESREDILQLLYTYTSKWFARVGQDQLNKWESKDLIPQLLYALSSGTSTGSINLLVPLTLRHVTNRAVSMRRELQESEEIIRVGIDVVNSVNSNTGAMGQAYSLLIFEVVLSIWETMPEEIRSKKMSDGMVEATTRILMDIDELLGRLPGETVTTALRSKIGTTVCSEPFNLSPTMLENFVSELTAKKAEICTTSGIGAIVKRLRGRFFDDTTP